MESLLPFLKEFLPEFIVDHFDLIRYTKNGTQFDIYVDEKNDPPVDFKVESKGFYPVRQVEDFPIRGKRVILHIRRRRWRRPVTKQVISREWTLPASGTRMTESFALFLKEISG